MTINNSIAFGNKSIGLKHPVFITAEIGINHNGDIDIAKSLIEAAANAGADAVKFQKRTPSICVPEDQRDKYRETPWGYISYFEYRERMEFDANQYFELGKHAATLGLEIFASPWDIPSLEFLIQLNHPGIKIASACLTDLELIKAVVSSQLPVIASTGMSTIVEIDKAMELLSPSSTVLCHTTSSYPCKLEELNLRMIQTLRDRFNVQVGYSGHEVGLAPSLAAVALGAVFLERHITLDRSMWGTDQSASIEPIGFRKLVRDVRAIELALGDGIKKFYDSELQPRQKLRRIRSE